MLAQRLLEAYEVYQSAMNSMCPSVSWYNAVKSVFQLLSETCGDILGPQACRPSSRAE